MERDRSEAARVIESDALAVGVGVALIGRYHKFDKKMYA